MARFVGPTWRPPGSCRPERGHMLARWNLLSGWMQTIYNTCQNRSRFSFFRSRLMVEFLQRTSMALRDHFMHAPNKWETTLHLQRQRQTERDWGINDMYSNGQGTNETITITVESLWPDDAVWLHRSASTSGYGLLPEVIIWSNADLWPVRSRGIHHRALWW